MDTLDQHYLTLQFRYKVFRISGAEFQRFCEDIFLKAFPDFKPVKPHGRYGDGGNDGFRASAGIYYQMYAPETPQTKGPKVAEKLKSDFEKLKENWDAISPIKSYFFVFNDKGNGTNIIIERALSELREDNPEIDFASFLVADLERTFFGLDQASILGLGFNIDSTKAVAQARKYLEVVETYLDRENGAFAEKVLAGATKIVSDLQDDELSLTYEILVCRILHKQEKHSKAIKKYEDLCRKHLNDPRPFLYLAELHLSHDDVDKNAELIEQAESIDAGHWLVKLEKLVRDLHCGIDYDISQIDELTFPPDPRIRSSYYRLFAAVLANAGQHAQAGVFIDRAIELNPDRLLNYFVKFSLLRGQVFSKMADKDGFRKGLDDLYTEVRLIEEKIAEWGDIGPRIQSTININRIQVAYHQQNIRELEHLAKPTFELLMKCRFDHSVDYLFVELLRMTMWPPADFQALLTHLRGADIKPPSDHLTHSILIQFFLKKSVLTGGKEFFTAIKRKDMLALINTLENRQYDETWAILTENLELAVMVAQAAKEFPELRRNIVQNLPDDARIQREKLLLLLDYDEDNMNDAFVLLKSFDLSELSVVECAIPLEVARAKEAWDFVIVIVEKLLQHETDKRVGLQLRLQLCEAQFRLDQFSEAALSGETILSSTDDLALLNEYNRVGLLGQTISARSMRGENKQAKTLLEAHREIPKTFEFKLAVEAQVYLRNNEPQNALAAVFDAARIQGAPTPEQYGSLFMLFGLIGNLMELPLTSLESVEVNTFVRAVSMKMRQISHPVKLHSFPHLAC